MTTIPRALSPCRPHPCSREHAELVHTYRSLTESWREAAEQATGGYPTELALYRESHPAPKFRDFLTHSRRTA
ncbi:MAG: hypothetical protein WBA97_32730 [Actinophytocola sp.]|uniref:hypothetical protein n=1 Tax=Actinophytocola sp. TaxID=1872138 RepID=UPI003C7628F2